MLRHQGLLLYVNRTYYGTILHILVYQSSRRQRIGFADHVIRPTSQIPKFIHNKFSLILIITYYDSVLVYYTIIICDVMLFIVDGLVLRV